MNNDSKHVRCSGQGIVHDTAWFLSLWPIFHIFVVLSCPLCSNIPSAKRRQLTLFLSQFLHKFRHDSLMQDKDSMLKTHLSRRIALYKLQDKPSVIIFSILLAVELLKIQLELYWALNTNALRILQVWILYYVEHCMVQAWLHWKSTSLNIKITMPDIVGASFFQ